MRRRNDNTGSVSPEVDQVYNLPTDRCYMVKAKIDNLVEPERAGSNCFSAKLRLLLNFNRDRLGEYTGTLF